jgi:4,5-DOPA dioxygenase extradiol
MYPEAKIPVLQLSIDYSRPGQYHYDLAKEIAALRKKGVLIIGSGNMVHNLGMINWSGNPGDDFGYDWALEMNEKFKKAILEDDHGALINYKNFGGAGKNAIPTPDHYFPLISMTSPNYLVNNFFDKVHLV